MNAIEKLSTALKDRPHTFKYLRLSAGIRLSDRQFLDLIKQYPDRFKLVRFKKKTAEGSGAHPELPGLQGVRLLRADAS